mgnify:CR=1 FL=1
MTGCYAPRAGTTKVINPHDRVGIRPDEITTLELLKTAGCKPLNVPHYFSQKRRPENPRMIR